MRLNRTHLVPVLAIVAGGVIGASLSFGLLGPSPAVDVPAPNPVVAPSATRETDRRLEPLARETAEQQLADAVRRLEDHAAAMRRTPVREGYRGREAPGRVLDCQRRYHLTQSVDRS